jgi:hypothetical protein
MAISNRAASAIHKATGKSFSSGPICSTLYEVGGSSCDWAFTALKLPFSFSVELRPEASFGAKTSAHYTGFILPPSEISEASTETFGMSLITVPTKSLRFCIKFNIE